VANDDASLQAGKDPQKDAAYQLVQKKISG
jgi:hypothetical protein